MAKDNLYSSKMNTRKLSMTQPGFSNNAGTAYGNKTNSQRLSFISKGKKASEPARSGTYSQKINNRRLASVNPAAFEANASLYSRLGAKAAVSSVLRAFYGKALPDSRIRHYFDLDTAQKIEQQIQIQLDFLTVLLGGPNQKALDLNALYVQLAELGVTHLQFDIVAEYVTLILRGQNTPELLIDEVISVSEATRRNVLG